MSTADDSNSSTTKKILEFLSCVVKVVCAKKFKIGLNLETDAESRWNNNIAIIEGIENRESTIERKLVSWFRGSDGLNSHLSKGRLKRASFLILSRCGGVESYDVEIGVEGEGEGGCYFSEAGVGDVGSEALLNSFEEHFVDDEVPTQEAQEEERFLSMELELRSSPTEPPTLGAAASFTAPTPYPSVHHPLTYKSPIPQSPLPHTFVFGKFTTPWKQTVRLSTSTFSPQGSQPVIFGTLPPPSLDPPQADFSQNTNMSLKTFGSEETKTIVVQTPSTKEGEKTGVAYNSLLDMFQE
ncbi:hypothetical protein TrCOL_g10044 [Triparma columacea]|uniref:Uncharacterized protein n=1 Tax=Triparma columacea TaxID=722753 RepID=A0A9W7L784_9STRA|nr:hypothetical protein TrCOL_g10044 [Triparma columacea]